MVNIPYVFEGLLRNLSNNRQLTLSLFLDFSLFHINIILYYIILNVFTKYLNTNILTNTKYRCRAVKH